jgi:hypothetical protein
MIERSNARGNSHQTSLRIVDVCMQFITVISVTNSKKKKNSKSNKHMYKIEFMISF